MTPNNRISQIQKTLEAIQNGWPFFMALLQERITSHTEALINNDSEQTRGRIKALRELLELPSLLQQERDSISADLSEQDSAT